MALNEPDDVRNERKKKKDKGTNSKRNVPAISTRQTSPSTEPRYIPYEPSLVKVADAAYSGFELIADVVPASLIIAFSWFTHC